MTNHSIYAGARTLLVCSLFSLLFFSCAFRASSPHLEAKILNRTILVSVREDSSLSLSGAVVRVKNAKGEEILHGQTDGRGHFLFGPPRIEDLYISIWKDGQSVAETMVSKSELEEKLPKPPLPSETP